MGRACPCQGPTLANLERVHCYWLVSPCLPACLPILQMRRHDDDDSSSDGMEEAEGRMDEGRDSESIEMDDTNEENGSIPMVGSPGTSPPRVHGPATCEECQTSRASWGCDSCEMRLCDMCFDVLHRKGKRAKHPRLPLGNSSQSFSPPRQPDIEQQPQPPQASTGM